MKDVLNDFKKCGRPMTKNELKIKKLEEDLEAEKSTSSNLARRILKAIEYINDNIAVCAFNNKELPHWEFDDNNIQNLIKILKGENNE